MENLHDFGFGNDFIDDITLWYDAITTAKSGSITLMCKRCSTVSRVPLAPLTGCDELQPILPFLSQLFELT